MLTLRFCTTLTAAWLLASCGSAPAPRLETLPSPTGEPTAPVAPRSASAQDYSPSSMFHEEHGDFIAKRDRYRPDFVAEFRGIPNGSISGDRGDYDQLRLRAHGAADIVVDPDSFIRVGGKFGARDYDFSPDFGAEDVTLYEAGLKFGYGRFVSEDLLFEIDFMPGVYSDFGGTLKSDDWRFFGDAKVTFEYHEDLYLVGGVEANQVFKDVPIYPIAGVGWRFAPQWRFDMLLPRMVELSFAPTDSSSLFAGVEVDGDEYFTRTSVQFGKNGFDFRTQEIDVYFGGQQRFTDNLSGYAKIGVVVGGHNEIRRPNGSTIGGQHEAALLFEVGAGWDF